MTKMGILAVVLLATSSAATGSDLTGRSGERLRGSISCVHPSIVQDLIERIGEEQSFTHVLRIHIVQGYCVQADIPTRLETPMAAHAFRTWDGHDAETWQTIMELDQGDGTRVYLKGYSIVFPKVTKEVVSH